MVKNGEKYSAIGEAINTMYSLNSDIENRKAHLSGVLKSIEDEYEWVIKNTLNSKQICEILGITKPTLLKRRNAGLIQFVKFGRDFYYLKPEAALCSK